MEQCLLKNVTVQNKSVEYPKKTPIYFLCLKEDENIREMSTHLDLFNDPGRSVVYTETNTNWSPLGVPRSIQPGFYLNSSFSEKEMLL